MDYNEELNCLVVYSVVRYYSSDVEEFGTFLNRKDAERLMRVCERSDNKSYYRIKEVYIELSYEKE